MTESESTAGHNSTQMDKYLDFEALLAEACTYEAFEEIVTNKLDELRKQKKRVAFISGPLEFKDKPETVTEMKKTTTVLRSQFTKDTDPIVFSSLDIFKGKAWKAWEGLELTQEERRQKMQKLCREVVTRSTDLFMLKGWHGALGSIDEYKTALEHGGIAIHDLAPLPQAQQLEFNRTHGIPPAKI